MYLANGNGLYVIRIANLGPVNLWLKGDLVRPWATIAHSKAPKIVLCLLSMIALASCGEAEKPRDDRVPVRTVVVGSTAGATALSGATPEYAGSIASSFDSDVAFRVAGRIVTRRAGLGDRVSVGSALATLDPEPFRIAARSAEASVAAARAELIQAEGEYARNAPLAAERIVAPAQVDRLRAQRDSARARLLDVQARAAAARDDLGYATLRSPTAGVVTQVNAEVGQYLTPGQAAFRVARPDALDAIVDVPESIIASLRPGMPATITISSSQAPVSGKLREVSPAADPATRTYRVKVSLATTGNARIGMTAKVSFPATTGTAMSGTVAGASFTLPLTAITQSGKRPAVWVVKGSGALELRPVTLGTYADNGVTVRAGVRRGERVVSAGVHRLDEGQRVKLWDGRLP